LERCPQATRVSRDQSPKQPSEPAPAQVTASLRTTGGAGASPSPRASGPVPGTVTAGLTGLRRRPEPPDERRPVRASLSVLPSRRRPRHLSPTRIIPPPGAVLGPADPFADNRRPEGRRCRRRPLEVELRMPRGPLTTTPPAVGRRLAAWDEPNHTDVPDRSQQPELGFRAGTRNFLLIPRSSTGRGVGRQQVVNRDAQSSMCKQ
jgi:hypothetical protein